MKLHGVFVRTDMILEEDDVSRCRIFLLEV